MSRALLVLAVCFALATPAAAAPFTPEMEYAYQLALQHWGAEPSGCTSIDFEIVDDMPGREGEATIPAPGQRIACHMWIGRKLASPSWFIRMCAVVRHETGHLLGFDHSADPRSSMYPGIVTIPSQCWRAGLWVMNHPRRFR